jgi:hypothetical protein
MSPTTTTVASTGKGCHGNDHKHLVFLNLAYARSPFSAGPVLVGKASRVVLAPHPQPQPHPPPPPPRGRGATTSQQQTFVLIFSFASPVAQVPSALARPRG